MNQNQVNLVTSMVDRMFEPMMELIGTDIYAEIIDEDEGEYHAIVMSILSSLLATTVLNFLRNFDMPEDELMAEYGKMLGLISLEALHFKPKNKGNLH